MLTGKLYIDGKWINGNKTFITYSPIDHIAIGRVVLAEEKHVQKAVFAASKALPSWKNIGVQKRAEIIGKAVNILLEKYGKEGELTSLKQLINQEMGKPIPEADIEVIESSDMLSYFVEKGPELLVSRSININNELWPTKTSRVLFEPVGVVGIIKPWNYPLELPLWAIGPALIAGNTVVFKPSEYSSFVAIELIKIFSDAGLPDGVLNLVTGDETTGKLVVQNKDVDMISFTGSYKVGREIAIECASQFKKFNGELSGNDAAIVNEDANVELAANGLVWGAFCNAGQVCVGIKRAFIHERIAEDLIPAIVEKVKNLRIGIDIGPLISSEQLQVVVDFVKDAKSKGAKILSGGNVVDGNDGFFYYPTVLIDINKNMKLMKEECFGPLLPIYLVSSLDEAVELANLSEYGLGASVWTSDDDLALSIAKLLKVGTVWINDVNIAYPEAPWSGVKNSGCGVELSEWGLYEFTNIKHVNIENSHETSRIWWYPY